MSHRRGARIMAVLCLLWAGAAHAVTVALPAPGQARGFAHQEDERLLVDALIQVSGGHLDAALRSIETLVARNPRFRLAQMVYGDLLLAKAGRIGPLGALAGMREEVLAGLREEARLRLRHYLEHPPSGYLPGYLIQTSASERRVVVVDVGLSRLYLFENGAGGPRLVADYYAASGKNGAAKLREGDRKTPLGVYFVSAYLQGRELPDLYGAGAFPIDYPNPWDRRLGRTGHGIWVHGVPSDTFSRSPRSSDGCVTLANADFNALVPVVEVGRTPVIIAGSVEWVAPEALAHRREGLLRAVERWRRDREYGDPRRLARHYSREFQVAGQGYADWRRGRPPAGAEKGAAAIEIQLSDLGLLADPVERDTIVATFDEHQRGGSEGDRTTRKRQYWRREMGGSWRIVYEGAF